jgi:MprA protease rhombosortase-interaction domain-containing protein
VAAPGVVAVALLLAVLGLAGYARRDVRGRAGILVDGTLLSA